MRVLRSSEKVKYGYVKNAIVAIDDGLAFYSLLAQKLLYDDNTEIFAESTEYLVMHDGLSGVII